MAEQIIIVSEGDENEQEHAATEAQEETASDAAAAAESADEAAEAASDAEQAAETAAEIAFATVDALGEISAHIESVMNEYALRLAELSDRVSALENRTEETGEQTEVVPPPPQEIKPARMRAWERWPRWLTP